MNYQRSCVNCKIEIKGDSSTLFCGCRKSDTSPTFETRLLLGRPPRRETQLQQTSASLDTHYAVYNGHILSDIFAPPQIPSKASTIPFPTSLWATYGGEDETEEFGKRNCTSRPFAPDDHANIKQNYPVQCHQEETQWWHFQWKDLKFTSNQPVWELVGYADENCKEEIYRSGPKDYGVCKRPGKLIEKISIVPLFNGDLI